MWLVKIMLGCSSQVANLKSVEKGRVSMGITSLNRLRYRKLLMVAACLFASSLSLPRSSVSQWTGTGGGQINCFLDSGTSLYAGSSTGVQMSFDHGGS